MKNLISQLLNIFKWLGEMVGVLILVLVDAQFTAAQKPGWTLVFNDEFNQPNVDALFNATGLWCSRDMCWDSGSGSSYNPPVPPLADLPPGCQQPTINTTEVPGSGTVILTARKNPGSYAAYRFVTVNLTKGQNWVIVPTDLVLGAGNPVADAQGALPPGTTIKTAFRGSLLLSNAATADATSDQLSVLTCAPFTYTGAALYSKRSFLYGYFEIRAKIPVRGTYNWPSFWMWGADSPSTYRELDVFEFGTDPKILDHVMMNLHLAQGIDGGPSGSSGWNDYPSDYIVNQFNGGPNVSIAFHLYAAYWTPSSVTWYVDNKPVHQVVGHSPHLDMHLLAATGIVPWSLSDSSLPANYEIDYIRVYVSNPSPIQGDTVICSNKAHVYSTASIPGIDS